MSTSSAQHRVLSPTAYLTPGVYFEKVDRAPPVVTAVRTDIAGFVGFSERGPDHEPTRITSWKQFLGQFGGFATDSFLPYAVKGFFDNGGLTCYVVRVVGPDARRATLAVPGQKPSIKTALIARMRDPQRVQLPVPVLIGAHEGDVLFVATRGQREHGVIAAKDSATSELILDRPLQWTYAAGSPVWIFSPVLIITAASPGAWADRLRITLTKAIRGVTTTSRRPQPVDGSRLYVESVAGFESAKMLEDGTLIGGSLVRIWQDKVQELRRIHAIDPPDRSGDPPADSSHILEWTSPPLPSRHFDFSRQIFLETVEVNLEAAMNGVRERFLNLSIVYGHSRYIEDVINTESTLIRVYDLLQFRDRATGRLHPAWVDGFTRPARPRGSAGSPLWPPQFPDMFNGTPGKDDRPLVEEIRADGSPAPAFIAHLSGGFDDLANVEPGDFTGEPPRTNDSRYGLSRLEEIDDIGIVAIPDAVFRPTGLPARVVPDPRDVDRCYPPPPRDPPPPAPRARDVPPGFSLDQIATIQRALIAHCEKLRDRVAVLDPPTPRVDFRSIQDWKAAVDSERGFAALYFPWLQVFDPLQRSGGLLRAIPPSGHVAGVYARTDLDPSAGVHKAPANAALEWIADVTTFVDDPEHALLNEQGIDVIRPYPGRGIRVFGARTISADPNWRYINVRRLMSMIQRAVWLTSQWSVFEPNTFVTRETLRLSTSAFLLSLLGRGALAGTEPEQAFYVKCNEENNPPDIVDAGQLIVEIGVAPALPAEFVVFRLGRIENQLVVME